MKYSNSIKLIVHALFWVFYVLVVFILQPTHSTEEISWIARIDFKLLGLALFITYLNDAFLLPYFFKKKKHLSYSFIIVVLLLLSCQLYCYVIVKYTCPYFVCLSQELWKFLLPTVFLSLIWILLAFFEKQKELEKSRKQQLEMELKFLKSQINPHVLFNNLNTIYAQAVKGSDNVADMILMLSENLKYILYQSDATKVPLEKDIDFIDNYLQFQKLRTQGINRITFNKNIDSYNHTIAPLLLIGLIENAFKHSCFKEEDLSDITIDLNVVDGKLLFKCTNEVDEDSGSRETEGFQIGLKNLRKRLDILYPKRHLLTINDKKTTFTAILEITL